MTSRRETGRRGEEAASGFIQNRGFTIVGRNVRVGRNEIDIVAEKDGVMTFVEVRTRTGRSAGSPEESITTSKQASLIRAAQGYLIERQIGDIDWRIDVIAVDLDRSDRIVRINHIENAVESTPCSSY